MMSRNTGKFGKMISQTDRQHRYVVPLHRSHLPVHDVSIRNVDNNGSDRLAYTNHDFDPDFDPLV